MLKGVYRMNENTWLIGKIADVVDRFQFHKEKVRSDNPIITEFAKKMCEIELYEMWMLTQRNK